MAILRFLAWTAFCLILPVAYLACGKSPSAPTPTPASSNAVLFAEDFSRYPNGLITNEFAFWNPTSQSAKHSDKWEMTSGSLFAQNGEGWTGVPDNVGPNALSSNATNSAVFRLTTKQSGFSNVSVSLELLNQGLTETKTTPRADLDGAHIFLRYQSEESLYYASVNRRDNTAVIKKKVRGGTSNGGTYYDLSSYVNNSVPYQTWQSVVATIRTNPNGFVAIELSLNGRLVVSAVDNGAVGGAVITQPGKVGVRGDNANLKFRNFTVKSL